MKHISKFIFILFTFVFQYAFSYTYIESKPEAIQAYLNQGIGAIHNYEIGNGNIRRMVVRSLQENSDGTISVKIEPVDQTIILDFDSYFKDSDVPVVEALNRDDHNRDLNASRDGASGSFQIGIDTSVMAGIQVAMILGSGANEKIERAYQRIAELQKKMGSDFDRIKKARLDLYKSAAAVILTGDLVAENRLVTKDAVYKSQKDIKFAFENMNLIHPSLPAMGGVS